MKLPPLHRGHLLKRYKRFLADVELEGGEVITAHCANPGAMTGLAVPGSEVFLSRSDDPKRKLPYSWELCRVGRGLVCVNTARANPIAHEALLASRVAELAGFLECRREVSIGESRIDFRLEFSEGPCWVEVKNVTLDRGGGTSAFPDSVTKRGARHLRELRDLKRRGERAVLLFCSSRSDTRRVIPARDIDPAYADALLEAHTAGVEIIAYAARVTQRELCLTNRIPVELE
ncbi:MAG: DNA/RNA nuclease SfsA [Polyangiaceae bacterium]|nr:DNA/RNA nuclease SfsA [Polyangiaceae bacterium]